MIRSILYPMFMIVFFFSLALLTVLPWVCFTKFLLIIKPFVVFLRTLSTNHPYGFI